jgi:hypothetical protein
MRKPREVEEMLKRAIRDEIALHPLMSVAKIQGALSRAGYKAVNGPLDWHYVNKLVKKVRQENLANLFPKDRTERFAMLQERKRVITEKLIPIVEGKWTGDIHKDDRMVFPTAAERIAAANTILKWDMAVFFAEEQVKKMEIAERQGPLQIEPRVIEAKVRRYRTNLRKETRTEVELNGYEFNIAS